MDPNDANAAEKLKAELRLQELLSQNPRITFHGGALEIGQQRGAIFDNDTGAVVIVTESMIHVDVVIAAGLPLVTGRYLSGGVAVTDSGQIEWITTGAMSSFPADDLPLPLKSILDKIRGSGIRVA